MTAKRLPIAARKREHLELLASHPMDRATCRKKGKLLLKFMECDDPSLRTIVERTIRWNYVASLISVRRIELGFTVAAVAKQLKLAVYKITEVEQGRIDARMYPVLIRYVQFLGIGDPYQAWTAMNRDLVAAVSKESTGT